MRDDADERVCERVDQPGGVQVDDAYPMLAELVALVAPPEQPIPVDGDWRAFVAVNGFEPPSEWVALLGRYGYCSVGGEAIQLRDPFPPGSFVLFGEHERRRLRGSIAACSWYPRWPVWPDPGGFLPWADLRDGSGEIGWLTIGAPDDWHVAVLARGGHGVETSFTTLAYLVHLARHIQEDADEVDDNDGIGWMDAHTSIPARFTGGSLPTYEPLEVWFAALPSYPVPDGPIPADAEERRVWLDRQRDRAAPTTKEAWQQRWADAHEVLDRAAQHGIRISAGGFQGTGRGPVHPTAHLSYPVGAEESAKQTLADLAETLGTTVSDVRNLEQQTVWVDLFPE